jgi:hypothetical protein
MSVGVYLVDPPPPKRQARRAAQAPGAPNPVTAVDVPQHPDKHSPERPVLPRSRSAARRRCGSSGSPTPSPGYRIRPALAFEYPLSEEQRRSPRALAVAPVGIDDVGELTGERHEPRHLR